MAIRLVVTMHASKGRGDQFSKLFAERQPDVLKEPGCEEYALFRSVDNTDRFVLLERWKDQKHLDDHLVRIRANPGPHIGLRAGAPVLERYETP